MDEGYERKRVDELGKRTSLIEVLESGGFDPKIMDVIHEDEGYLWLVEVRKEYAQRIPE